MKVLTQTTAYLRRLISEPIGELNRAQRTLRFAVDLSRHCARQLGRNHASQMAAALTYRTIFGLVPMAVLMLLVFRAFGGFEHVSADLQAKIYDHLGLSSISLPAPADGAESIVSAPGDSQSGTPLAAQHREEAHRQLRAGIDRILADLTANASKVNVGSIGVVGLAVLIWAALALLITVERSFNQIYNCAAGRSWHLRVPIYWAVITLGPVLLFVSLYVAQQLVEYTQSKAVAGQMPTIVSGVVGGLSGMTALGASCLLLFLLYVLMPNRRVRLRPALVGALVAAVLWESGKWGFKLYVTKAVSYSTLYGSLGLVPLFLLWLYLTWLIVLFGLEITYTLQAMRGREFEKEAMRRDQRQVYDPRWLVPMMTKIGAAFRSGQVIDTEDLAQVLGLPETAVVQMGRQLHEAGLIHRVAGNGDVAGGYTLAQPPEDIKLNRLLELGQMFGHNAKSHPDDPAWRVLASLAKAQQVAAGNITLAGILDPHERLGHST